MNEVIKSIWKRKLLSFFLILQFVFVITYFFMTLASIQRAFNICIEVPKVLADKTDSFVHIEVQNDDVEIADFEKFCHVLKAKNIIDEITTYENFYFQSEAFDYEETGNLRIGSGMNHIKEFQIQDGRNFNDEDRDGEISSLVIGSELANEYNLKVGDMIEETMSDIKYEIIGVLKANSYWFQQSVSEGLILSLDKQVITLIPSENEEVKQHYYCVLNPQISVDKGLEQINEMAEKSSVILQATPITDELEQQYHSILNENIHWFVFSVIIMIMLAIGTAILTITHMYDRRREIGIRLAVGYTPQKIFCLFSAEIVSLIFLAYGLASVLGRFVIGNGIDIIEGSEIFTGYVFSWRVALLGGVAVLIMCIPSVAALFISIRHFQPKNLLGGKE